MTQSNLEGRLPLANSLVVVHGSTDRARAMARLIAAFSGAYCEVRGSDFDEISPSGYLGGALYEALVTEADVLIVREPPRSEHGREAVKMLARGGNVAINRKRQPLRTVRAPGTVIVCETQKGMAAWDPVIAQDEVVIRVV